MTNLTVDSADKPANHRFYCWTPSALLSVCFGTVAMALKSVSNHNKTRRIKRALARKSQTRRAPSQPLARFVRGIAADEPSSTTEITAVKNTVASLIVAARDKLVGSLWRAVFGVMVLSHDETEMVLLKRRNSTTRRNADGTLNIRFITVTRPVKILHCVLVWQVLIGMNAKILQMPCVSADITATNARCIWAAIFQSCPCTPRSELRKHRSLQRCWSETLRRVRKYTTC